MKKSAIKYPSGWVKESTFGNCFLNSDTWILYVLKLSLNSLEELLDPRKKTYSTILDVGCGFGHSLVELDQRFLPKKIIGLDVDDNLPDKVKGNIEKCNSEIVLQVNNAAKIDLPDNSVDMVFCHQTFHHIIDQESAIKEFYRVLKPGGVLLFAESCKRYIHSLIIRVLFRHPLDVQKTDIEYLALVEGAGFMCKPKNISRPFLWWSRWDLGVLETLGFTPKVDKEETLIYLAAYRQE
jgi:SAM-dependent methyltransferase